MRRLLLWVAWAFVAATGMSAAAATLPGPAFPAFRSAAALQAHCDSGLARARAAQRALERHPADARWLAAYDDLNALLEDSAGPVYVLSNVHPDKAIRDAADACELRWQDFMSSLGQNATLYAAATRLKRARSDRRAAVEDPARGLRGRRRQPAPAQRKRAKEINDRVTALGQEFDRNIRDARTQLSFSVEQLRGVPEAVWGGAKRDDQGQVLLGLDTLDLPVGDAGRIGCGDARAHVARQDQ